MDGELEVVMSQNCKKRSRVNFEKNETNKTQKVKRRKVENELSESTFFKLPTIPKFPPIGWSQRILIEYISTEQVNSPKPEIVIEGKLPAFENLENQYKGTIFFDLDQTLLHSTFLGRKRKIIEFGQQRTNWLNSIKAEDGKMINILNSPTTTYNNEENFDFSIKLGEGENSPRFGIVIRKGALEILQKLKDDGFEIIIFTASSHQYCDAICKKLDPESKIISYCLSRCSCSLVGFKGEKIIAKDIFFHLGKTRSFKRSIIVEDSAVNLVYHPRNGILVSKFSTNNKNHEQKKLDNELEKVYDVINYIFRNERTDVRIELEKLGIDFKSIYSKIPYTSKNGLSFFNEEKRIFESSKTTK